MCAYTGVYACIYACTDEYDLSYLYIQVNMNVYIDEYVGMLVTKDKYVCMYAYTDKSMYTRGNRQVRSENIHVNSRRQTSYINSQ
jgi:hypothetical protein